MKFPSHIFLVSIALMASLFVSCSSDDDSDNPSTEPTKNDLILINSAYTDQGQMLVNIYAKDSLQVEYTPIYVEVRDSASNAVKLDVTATLTPMMDMGMMMHSAPYEELQLSTENSMFQGAVVFIMPAPMGWTLNVDVYDAANDANGMAQVPVPVRQPSVTRTQVITPLNGVNSLVISYLLPLEPKVGVNDIEFTIHERVTGMDFQPVSDYTVMIEPEMPSMGHGSPNNVNPTDFGNGHYKGKVNFTMTGMWRINLDIYDGTVAKDTTGYFDITF